TRGATRWAPRVATTPTSGSIVSAYAFVTSQRSIAYRSGSAWIVAGSAENSRITTGGLGGGVPGKPAGGGACASAVVAPRSNGAIRRCDRAFIQRVTSPRDRAVPPAVPASRQQPLRRRAGRRAPRRRSEDRAAARRTETTPTNGSRQRQLRGRQRPRSSQL